MLGRDFPLDVLNALAGDEVDVVAGLDEAALVAVIVDSPGRVGDLRFGHAVMSEALYQEIPSLRRRRLHDEAGRMLEMLRGRDLGPRLAELARHCCASLPVGPVDRAVRYARLAGERAVQQLAFEEGARLFAMALHAFERRTGRRRTNRAAPVAWRRARVAPATPTSRRSRSSRRPTSHAAARHGAARAGSDRLQRALRVDASRIRHEDHPAAARGDRRSPRE